MRVSKNDSICGLDAPTARQLMRAQHQMHASEAAGYIERSGLARAVGDGW
jgi:hypothetical protein